ncbi:hypothetical protein W97_00618 [Coniosporium apollinis CBS 100218]|uniref:Uncharacterized protein n=1 Tax=Coniosporium apollinis (strain CBS 100218) TaxID=1168221 RepID=R7YHW6_CONA1|nr:uncharacterized protein W97_00618 [Coniosporium apollinis CBS 100218]EON61404.1 hypothetical protein W97_00618 [Coniosporium apollinis CBS 100218]
MKDYNEKKRQSQDSITEPPTGVLHEHDPAQPTSKKKRKLSDDGSQHMERQVAPDTSQRLPAPQSKRKRGEDTAYHQHLTEAEKLANQPFLQELVKPLRGNSGYLSAFWISLLQNPIGSACEPFKAMYQIGNPRINVEVLKTYCSQTFGTQAMELSWSPELTKSFQAFISTLSISSAHMEAMQGAELNGRDGTESEVTGAIRSETELSMERINDDRCDLHYAPCDENLMSVVHLLCAELISGHPGRMNFLAARMFEMVSQRGGLYGLGVSRVLAAILTT